MTSRARATSHDPPAIRIASKDDANKALWAMSRLKDAIAAIELSYQIEVRELEERLSGEVSPLKKNLAAYEKALEKWARRDYDQAGGWGVTRSIFFTCGKISFRLSPPAIKLARTIEYVLERLRARKMASCIRVKEEVNKEALEAYGDEILREVGCRRAQKDEFYYEIFPEVK